MDKAIIVKCPHCQREFDASARFAMMNVEEPPQPFLFADGRMVASFSRQEMELAVKQANQEAGRTIAQVVELS